MYDSRTSPASLLHSAQVYDGYYRTFKACGRDASVTYYTLLLCEVPGRQLLYHIDMALDSHRHETTFPSPLPPFRLSRPSTIPKHPRLPDLVDSPGFTAQSTKRPPISLLYPTQMEANTDPATVTCSRHPNGSGGVSPRKAENTNHKSPQIAAQDSRKLLTRKMIELHLQGTSSLITRKGERNLRACLQIAREGQEWPKRRRSTNKRSARSEALSSRSL